MSMQVTSPAQSVQPKKTNFANTPIGDAVAWGVGNAAVGAGMTYFSEKNLLKNPAKLKDRMLTINEELMFKDLKPKRKNFLENSLKYLEKGKINYKAVGKSALNFGLWGFIPTLLIDGAVSAMRSARNKKPESVKK